MFNLYLLYIIQYKDANGLNEEYMPQGYVVTKEEAEMQVQEYIEQDEQDINEALYVGSPFGREYRLPMVTYGYTSIGNIGDTEIDIVEKL